MSTRAPQSTTARLKADIDRGLTGDKMAAVDPAAAPLGTDDEAAGHPPTRERVEMARKAELKAGAGSRSDTMPRGNNPSPVLWLCAALVVLLGGVLLSAVWFRHAVPI